MGSWALSSQILLPIPPPCLLLHLLKLPILVGATLGVLHPWMPRLRCYHHILEQENLRPLPRQCAVGTLAQVRRTLAPWSTGGAVQQLEQAIKFIHFLPVPKR